VSAKAWYERCSFSVIVDVEMSNLAWIDDRGYMLNGVSCKYVRGTQVSGHFVFRYHIASARHAPTSRRSLKGVSL
jgi:hypothetical protein